MKERPRTVNGDAIHDSSKIIFGESEMANQIRAFDWSKTSLGAINKWPQSLRFAVNMMLQSPASLVVLWGTEGIALYNDAYISFAGSKHPAILGSPYKASWPEAAEFVQNIISRCLRGESLTYTGFTYTVDRNNKPTDIWKDLQCSPILDDNGKPAGVLMINTETTQYVQAEEALKQSEERYRLVIAGTNEGVWDYNLTTGVTFWNDRIFEILGYTRGEVEKPGYEFLKTIIHPDDREKVQAAIDETLKEGVPVNMEYRAKHKQGHYISLHAKGKPVLDAAGKIIRLSGITIDISERKRSIEILKENEDRLSGIFNQTSVGIAETDLAGKFVLANEQFCQIVGRTKEDLYQLDLSDVTHAGDLAANYWQFERVVKEGIPATVEKRFIWPDGTEVWVKNNISLVRDADGNPLYILAVSQDITERRQAELEKNRLLEQTQALNKELERSQHKLLRQNERLKKINTELDSFVYRTSHDLRAPLASVLGLINVCRLDTDETNQRTYLNLMEKSISRLDNFISDIINFSRNSRVAISQQKIDLTAMIQESLDGFKFMDGYESIDKSLVIEQEQDFYSDAFRLKIICNNLISNAIKYRSAAEDKSCLLIKVHVNKERALLTFKDNGRGIALDKVDKIFNMFYRASESSSGSGLGLYIVKEVVQTLKGKIFIESKLGQGTTFNVEVPNAVPAI